MKPEYFLLPDVAEMWVQGKVTGTGASIAASVNGADAIPMNRRGDIFGYLVPLEPGTNVVVVTSADAAGQNPSSKVLVVERTDLYQVQLQQWWYGNASTLGKGEFNNGSPRYVEGTVNAQIEYGGATLGLAAVSVNGSAAWFEDWGGGQGYFAMTNSVNGGTNCTVMPLVLALCYTNGNYSAVLCPKVPLGLLEGYEIASKTVHYRKDAPTLVGSSVWWPPAFWIDYNATNGACAGQWVIVRAKKQVEQESFSMPCTATETNSVLDDTTYAAATNCVAVPALTNITAWAVASEYGTAHLEQHLTQPGRSLRFGTFDAYSAHQLDETHDGVPVDGLVDSERREIGWRLDEGEMVVHWPFYYPAGQVVILTFEGVDYQRVAGEEFVGSNVLYQGQAPVAVSGHDLSYLVTCPGGSNTFTLNAVAFTWPESAIATNYVEAEWEGHRLTVDNQDTSHHLSFTGFHNCNLRTMGRRGSSGQTNGVGWMSDEARFDFQAVTTGAANWYRLKLQASHCDDCGYNWDLDHWVGSLLADGKEHSRTPTHQPPAASMLGDLESADGEIRLAYSGNKKVKIYRDHLARDVDNFRSGKSCRAGYWDTPYGKTTEMPKMECYESVDHACLGRRDAKEDSRQLETDLKAFGWTNTEGETFNYPFTGNGITATNNLKRGDVVLIYSYACDNTRIQHGVVVTADGKVWSANNGTLCSAPIVFNKIPLADVMNAYTNCFSECKIRIRILKAPPEMN